MDICNILFIVGGVFESMSEIVCVCINVCVVGFGVEYKGEEKEEVCFFFEDFVKFGLIFEFVGCLLFVV